MAFENLAASDPIDLIQKLNTFLVANGWTSDSSVADGTGWRLHVHKGAIYTHLRVSQVQFAPFKSNHGVNGYSLCLYVGTGFNGGNAWNDQQAGAPTENGDVTRPVGAGMRFAAGSAIPNYFFFTDANDNVVVVVEHSAGLFSHIGWGPSLLKAGTWTGGAYFFGTWGGYFIHDNLLGTPTAGDAVLKSCNCPGVTADPEGTPNWFVRADVDSFVGQWISGSDSITAISGYTGKTGASPILGASNPSAGPHERFPCYSENFGAAGDFQANQVSALDGRANLLPVVLYVQRDGSGPGYSPLGAIPGIFVTSGVGNGFSPKSDYVIGADTYTMFPEFAVKKNV